MSVRNPVLRLGKGLMVNSSYGLRKLRGASVTGRILMYHRVDDVQGDRLVVNPEAFKEQMRWLKRQEIRVVDLDTLISSLEYADENSINQVAITFDDGYEDNHRHAWPILRQFGYPATVFVSAGLIGTDRPIPAERPYATPAKVMTWEQLEEMAKDNITIGSHALTHARLTRIPLERVKQEVAESKRILEERLDCRVDWFCYPSGAYSVDVVKLVQWAGYYGACTVRPGANSARTHRFLLRRTEISGEDILGSFKKKLTGAYDGWHTLVQSMQHWSHRKKRHSAGVNDGA